MNNSDFAVQMLIAVLTLSLTAMPCQAQNGTFADLFKAAYECSGCPDSTQIAMYTEAIDHGASGNADRLNLHNALVNRGKLLGDNGDFKQAIEDFERALDMEPNDYHVRQELATAHLQASQFEEALKEFDRYINRLEKEKEENLKAYTIDQRQRQDSALIRNIQEMKKTAKAEWNADLAVAYNNRGICKGQLRNHRGACADFRKAYKAGMHNLKGFIDEECK